LVRADVKLLRRFFPCIQVQGFQLAAMAHRVAPSARLRRPLDWCDAMLLELIPALRQFCRYVVLTLHASE
jgi:hypothetical protein